MRLRTGHTLLVDHLRGSQIVLWFEGRADNVQLRIPQDLHWRLAAKGVPLRRIVLASVVSTASIATNDIKKPMKKQCVSALIPRDYKPLAKCVPGIAGFFLTCRRFDSRTKPPRDDIRADLPPGHLGRYAPAQTRNRGRSNKEKGSGVSYSRNRDC